MQQKVTVLIWNEIPYLVMAGGIGVVIIALALLCFSFVKTRQSKRWIAMILLVSLPTYRIGIEMVSYGFDEYQITGRLTTITID